MILEEICPITKDLVDNFKQLLVVWKCKFQ